jgi:hypothetical protein
MLHSHVMGPGIGIFLCPVLHQVPQHLALPHQFHPFHSIWLLVPLLKSLVVCNLVCCVCVNLPSQASLFHHLNQAAVQVIAVLSPHPVAVALLVSAAVHPVAALPVQAQAVLPVQAVLQVQAVLPVQAIPQVQAALPVQVALQAQAVHQAQVAIQAQAQAVHPVHLHQAAAAPPVQAQLPAQEVHQAVFKLPNPPLLVLP